MDILMTIVLTCLALLVISLLLSVAAHEDQGGDFSDIFAHVLARVTGIVLVVGLIALLSIGIYIEFI